ncbi:MAG: hypothetical protein ACNA8R_04545 [Nitriliruptoraceae bacterium]
MAAHDPTPAARGGRGGAAGVPDIGVFARSWRSQAAAALARTIADHSFGGAQLNRSAVGLPTMPTPEERSGIDLAGIRGTFDEVDVSLWGPSATDNMAHPDPATREDLTNRAVTMIDPAPRSGPLHRLTVHRDPGSDRSGAGSPGQRET